MKPRQWRRSSVGRYLRHLPRIKHMRGTWLHRKLGDRLFAREMWQPERGRFAFGCALGVFFAMMPLPFQMVAAALLAFLVRVNIPAAVACTWVIADHAAHSICSTIWVHSFWEGGKRSAKEDMRHAREAPVASGGALISGTILALGAYPLALAGWDWLSARCSISKRVVKKIPSSKMLLSSCTGA
jgi:uncharacterized protein (DUF2062 family)